MYVNVYYVSIQVNPMRDVFLIFLTFIHPFIYIQAVSRVSREHWACVEFTGNEDVSQTEGA